MPLTSDDALFERLSQQARSVMVLARQEARARGQAYVGTENLLLGLMLDPGGGASQVLRELGVTLEALRREVQRLVSEGSEREVDEPELPFTPSSRRVVELALEEAEALGHTGLRSEHLLLGIIRMPECIAARTLAGLALRRAQVREVVLQHLGQTESNAPTVSSTPALDAFGHDLGQLATAGTLPPMVCREVELRRLIVALGCSLRTGVALVGEPGVGRSALLEGLAQALAQDRVTGPLQGHRLMLLGLPSLLSGVRSQGHLNQRLLGVLREARVGQVILVVEDVAQAEGFFPLGLLHGFLTRGLVRCVLTFTPAEHQLLVEENPALASLLSLLRLAPTSAGETLAVLQAHLPALQAHHRVTITDDAVQAAAQLSRAYPAGGRQQPAGALDLLDVAAAMEAAPEPEVATVDLAAVLQVVSQATGLPVERLHPTGERATGEDPGPA